MMKQFFISLAIVFTSVIANAQTKQPVLWNFTVKKLTKNSYELHLTATIDRSWHIYSQFTPEGGPAPTAISFSKNPLITMDGTTRENGKMEQHHEELFGVDVKQYSDKVDFVQKINKKGTAKTIISGTIEFMSCNDKQCLPPYKQPFTIAID